MSNNGQVIYESPDSWHHSHRCYTCNKHYECSWSFCRNQEQRNCAECARRI